MSQSGKLMPNLDQQSTKVLNLTVLQRIDPFVEEILMTAAHVTFYEFNIELNQWVWIHLSICEVLICFGPSLLLPSFPSSDRVSVSASLAEPQGCRRISLRRQEVIIRISLS